MAVSAIVPTYNREDVIKRCVDSLLRQSKPVDEIIIVDDASTDNTRRVVENMDNETVEYIKHAENEGAAAARNTGIEYASGEYILFLDSDDVLHPTAVEKMYDVLHRSRPACAGVFTHYKRIGENEKVTQVWDEATGIVTDDDLSDYLAIPGISGSLFVSSILDRVDGFDEQMALSEDADLAHRIVDEANLYVIGEVLLTSYDSGNQLTSYEGGTNDELYLESEQLFLRKHGDSLTNEHFNRRCINAGFAAYRTGNVDEGNRLLVTAVSSATDASETAFALQYIGRHCANHGDTETAISYFKRSLGTDVTQYPVYLYLLLSAFGEPVWMTAKKVKRRILIERYRLKRWFAEQSENARYT